MSITDELRSYAEVLDNVAVMTSEHDHSPAATQIRRIADLIDRQHERDIRDAYASGAADALGGLDRRVSAIERKLSHKGSC